MSGPVYSSCADPESFVRGGPILITSFFSLVDEGGESIQITLKAGHHWPNSERFAGGPMMVEY